MGVRRVLTVDDREAIGLDLAAGLSLKVIAARVGRDPSVISREARRHGRGPGGYRPLAAHAAAVLGRSRPKGRRLDLPGPLREHVIAHRRLGWSPDAIAGRLRTDPMPGLPTGHDGRVSHEAIYTWLYAMPSAKLIELGLVPVSGRTRRKPRVVGGTERRPRIVGMRMIEERPADAAGRQVPGHWEGDLVIGAAGASAVGTLVERTSKFLALVPLSARDSHTVTQAVADTVLDWPSSLRRSLTWDCGTEMARHAQLTRRAEIDVFFAHPHSPWERGQNEHTNRTLREYFPKGQPITDHPPYLKAVAEEINGRPRKSLGYKTPAEVFAAIVQEAEHASTS